MYQYDVLGLGSGVVDVAVHKGFSYLAQHSFAPGSSEIIEAEEQRVLLASIDPSEEIKSSGGSVANSTNAVMKLGGDTFFAGKVGNDRYGQHFIDELRRDGVSFGRSFQVEGPTAVSFIVVTPDGERTMRTALGVARDLSPADIDRDAIRSSEWIFVEGYLFANGASSQEAVRFAVNEAAKCGTKIAVTLASEFIASEYRALFEETLDKAKLVIGNKKEAMKLTDRPTFESAFDDLRGTGADLAISSGPDGVHIRFDGRETLVPAFSPRQMVSTVGAGDSMAGGLLFGLTHGFTPEKSILGGCYIATNVIQQDAARLSRDEMRAAWAAATGADEAALRHMGWKG
jgi:sugar/nucleoside kinase (ribokinase family)